MLYRFAAQKVHLGPTLFEIDKLLYLFEVNYT